MNKLILCIMLLIAGCQVDSPPAPKQVDSRPALVLDERAVKLYKLMAPAVAEVEIYDSGMWVRIGTAFGMTWGEKKGVVTAGHVVRKDAKYRLIYRGGKTVEVKGKKIDPDTDMAVLEVDELPALLPIASGDPEIGSDVYSVGNPLDQVRMLTVGVVENYDRGYIIAGAALAYGNSGGPLCNDKGEVVGLAVQIKPGWGQFNLFVPCSKLKAL